MPYARHFRITASGTMFGGQERFSYGVSFDRGGTQPNASGMQDIANDVAAFHARNLTGICAHAVLTEVKIADIGSDGKYVTDPFIFEMNVPGAHPVVRHPAQVSLAVSLVTARRGATGKGRFYLPAPAYQIEANGRINPLAAVDVRTAVKDFLDALNNEPNLDSGAVTVAVASTKGYNTPVTGVRVGTVLDTIRSRRRSLPESYTEPAALAGN